MLKECLLGKSCIGIIKIAVEDTTVTLSNVSYISSKPMMQRPQRRFSKIKGKLPPNIKSSAGHRSDEA